MQQLSGSLGPCSQSSPTKIQPCPRSCAYVSALGGAWETHSKHSSRDRAPRSTERTRPFAPLTLAAQGRCTRTRALKRTYNPQRRAIYAAGGGSPPIEASSKSCPQHSRCLVFIQRKKSSRRATGSFLHHPPNSRRPKEEKRALMLKLIPIFGSPGICAGRSTGPAAG